MRFNATLDVIAISLFCLSGCSMFKPGTLTRVEAIAVEDELKMAADEIKELEGDIKSPAKKVQRNGKLKNR